MKIYYLGVTLFLGVYGMASAANHQQYKNLKNPTEYLFSVSEPKIVQALRDSHSKIAPPPEPLHGSARNSADIVFGFQLFDYYTKRYWNGIQERPEEIRPPEAGRIGTIQAEFEVHVASRGENRTLVWVTVKSFQQQVGRKYRMSPHFHKGPVFVDVKSDTYFEYQFLLRLGELLGEMDMPPISGAEKM